MSFKTKYPDCPYSYMNEREAFQSWVNEHKNGICAVKLSGEQLKNKQAAYARTHYQLHKQVYLDRRKLQSLAEKQDRKLGKEGDAEAAARTRKLNDAGNARNWATGKCTPLVEQRAVNAAISYVLAPLRKQRMRDNHRKSNAKLLLKLNLAVSAGDQQAISEKARLDKGNRDKQAAWRLRTVSKAACGDKAAIHALWKITPEGREWRNNQISLGLGTRHQDLTAPQTIEQPAATANGYWKNLLNKLTF